MLRKPQNVYMPIDEFLAEVMERAEGDERSKWVSQFALQLASGRGNDTFATRLLAEATKGIEKNRLKQARYRAKQSLIEEGIAKPTKEQIISRMQENEQEEQFTNDQVTESDISANGSQLDTASSNAADDCKVTTSSNNLVADGDTREGSQNFPTPKGAILESGTSAATNFSPAEAPTGNEGDELATPEGRSLLNSDGSLLESATSAGQRNSVRGSAKSACGQVATGRKQLPPPTKEAVYDFARTAKLDADDAREWFEINFVDRPGCDKDGIVIENWKGHCKNYCRAKAKRRKEED